MASIQTLAELDAILEPFRSSAFKDKEAAYTGYRNHCQRMANATLINLAALSKGQGVSPRSQKLVAVAAAFHDLGIWTDNTWDYLEPSWKDAKEYMGQSGTAFSEEEQALVVQMIDEHHKIFGIKCDGPNAEQLKMVEAFRRGDWMDVSFGFILGAVTREQYKQLNQEFPVAGFFGMLLGICISSWLKNPLSNPMPMMRW